MFPPSMVFQDFICVYIMNMFFYIILRGEAESKISFH